MTKFRAKNLIAILCAALFAVLLFFSLGFIVEEADHVCVGEDCEICTLIQIAQDNIGNGDKQVTESHTSLPFIETSDREVCSYTYGERNEKATPISLCDILII